MQRLTRVDLICRTRRRRCTQRLYSTGPSAARADAWPADEGACAAESCAAGGSARLIDLYTLTVYISVMINVVEVADLAERQLRKLPRHIVKKLFLWVNLVKKDGLEEARKRPSLHDEPLKGDREGQRSIRLNRAYRAIYRIVESGEIELVRIEEVNKHDY